MAGWGTKRGGSGWDKGEGGCQEASSTVPDVANGSGLIKEADEVGIIKFFSRVWLIYNVRNANKLAYTCLILPS